MWQQACFCLVWFNMWHQASQKKPLLGVHGCSIGQAKADGCEVSLDNFDVRLIFEMLNIYLCDRWRRASMTRAAHWRMTGTRLSLSSPSVPQTSQVLSAWPSSGKRPSMVNGTQVRKAKHSSCKHFRIIGLEETASSCQSILEPSFNNQVFFYAFWCLWFGLVITDRYFNFGSCHGWDWFEFMIFLDSGDDDIGPWHDLHHVPDDHHQINWC